MAVEERSTAQESAQRERGNTQERDARLHEELAVTIENLDFGVNSECHHIQSLAAAIRALSTETRVQDLASQVAFWAMSIGNDVNAFAEKLGCNHRGRA